MARLYRNPIFIVLVILIISGLTLVRFTSEERTAVTLVEQAISTVVAPLQRGVTVVQDRVTAAVSFVGELANLRSENQRLQDENEQLILSLNRMRQIEDENWRLRRQLHMEQHVNHEMLSASVIARDPSNWFSQVVINRGSQHGLARDMAVVTNEGIVGRVFEVSNSTAKVMLVTDTASAIGSRTRRTRDLGVAKGQGEQNPYLLLDYLAQEADVRPGDVVASSGLGEVIPPGIVIGTVVEVQEGHLGLTKTARLKPAVDLSKLEEVFVITVPVTTDP